MSAPGLKITNFHYSNTAFTPPAEFVEFPKWVHMAGYPSVIAQDAAEEAVLRARPIPSDPVNALLQTPPETFHAGPPVPPPTTMLQGSNDAREMLWKIAAEKGIKIDKRWKLPRLTAEMERAVPIEAKE